MAKSWTEQQVRTGPVRPPRPSHSFDAIESTPSLKWQHSSVMLRNRWSTTRSSHFSQPQNRLSHGLPVSLRDTGPEHYHAIEQRGSLRKAVRKLFGKKTKIEPPLLEVSHPSPQFLHDDNDRIYLAHPRFTLPERAPRRDSSSPATLRGYPTPMIEPEYIQSSSLQTRSTTATHFPKSAQLKPLNLDNPFYHRVYHVPRRPEPIRRATLPTLSSAQNELVSVETAERTHEPEPYLTLPEIGVAVTRTSVIEKRRSRSANDLGHDTARAPKRKRSAEIRFWRESFAGTVLLGSESPPLPEEMHSMDSVEDEVPMTRDERIEPSASDAPLPGTANGRVDGNISPPLATRSRPVSNGAELSGDIERRVASIEKSLHDFRFSLDSLTIPNSPQTSSPAIFTRRPIQRSPSLLAESLQQPPWRNSYESAGDVIEREWDDEDKQNNRKNSGYWPSAARQSSARTFVELCDLLTEERAARYRLESKFEILQREVAFMASRLERGSYNNCSAHGLQHHPRTPEESERAESPRNPPVLSRFSGSDSMAGSYVFRKNSSKHERRSDSVNAGAEPQSPFATYRTPLEERVPYGFDEHDETF